MSKNTSKRIIVFGANGVLGREVVRIFKEHKYTVRGYTHDSPIESDRIRSIICTEFRGEDAKDTIVNGKAALVVNCAAYNNVDEAETPLGSYKAYSVNAFGPTNIALACSLVNIPMVHISSDYVFGNTDEPRLVTYGFIEEDVPHPETVYGKSKLLGDINVERICKNSWILRTSGVYGRNLEGFPARVRKAYEEGNIPQLSSNSWYCPTYAPELARVVLEAFRKRIPFGLYNACGATRSPLAFVSVLFPEMQVCGSTFAVTSMNRAPRPKYSVLNVNKLLSSGIEPPTATPLPVVASDIRKNA